MELCRLVDARRSRLSFRPHPHRLRQATRRQVVFETDLAMQVTRRAIPRSVLVRRPVYLTPGDGVRRLAGTNHEAMHLSHR